MMNLLKHFKLNNYFLQKKTVFIILVLLFFDAVPCLPFELADNLQLHGFISQGYVITSDNKFCGDSDDNGSFDFREIGLNASYRPVPSLQFSAQALSRFAGESDDGSIRLDYGFIDYSVMDKASYQWGFRLGRVKTPFGLYNETRDVAVTRPSIFLPQSIYFDRTREVALSGDGLYLYGEYRTDLGNLFLKLGGGKPRVKDREVEDSLLGSNLPGNLDGDTSYNAQLLYEKDGGLIRLALTWGQLNMDYDSSARPPFDIDSGSIKFEPYVFSAQINKERWSLTGEYALRRLKYYGFSYPRIINRVIKGESYYIQGTYNFFEDWQGFVRYDILFSNKDDRNGKKSERPGHPAHSLFAKDLTFGLRWDISKYLMLRGEYHYVNGTAWLTSEDNPDRSKTERYWNMFSILIAYYF